MHRQVRNVMSTDVVTARPDTPFKELVRLLASRRVSALPVVDDHGRAVGVVSEADLLHKEELLADDGEAATGGHRARKARAKAAAGVAAELMTRPAVTVRPYTTLAEAARVLAAHGVKRAVVVDAGGRLVGVVSRADLLAVFLRPDDEIYREIREDTLLRSLWIDPDTVDVAVRDGVVTLAGRLERRSLTQIVVRLVRAVDGVVGVVDRLGWRVDDDEIGLPANDLLVEQPTSTSRRS